MASPRALFSSLVLTLAACTDAPTDKEAVVDTVDTDSSSGLSAPEVQIRETAPGMLDDLHAEVIDPDPGATYVWTWSSDGAPRPDVQGDTVPAIATRKGQVWTVGVAADIDGQRSPSGSAEVTIVNSLPSGELTLDPPDPTALVPLTVVATGIDDDEDEVTWTYEWVRNGSPTSIDGPSVNAASTTRGESWEVRGTPFDGEESGQVVSLSVTIRNAPPEVLSVDYEPADPTVEGPIVADADAIDGDGDLVTLSYRWFVGADEILGENTDSLDPQYFVKDDEVTVWVTPNDNREDGATFEADPVTVGNVAPTFTGVTLSPSDANANTVFACQTEGWSDADGDDPNYLYVWMNEGTPIVGASGATLDSNWFERGDRISCSATAWDGDDTGPTFTSAQIIVTNAPPTLTTVVLSQTDPEVTDVLTASAIDPIDADGDPVSVEYRWFANGFEVAAGSSYGGSLAAGAEIWAEARPFDGADYGEWVESNRAVVANTPPEVTSLTIGPPQARTNTQLFANAIADDADGHPVTLTYTWRVNGSIVATGASNILDSALFEKDQFVTVTVTPFDGFSDGAEETSDQLLILNTPPALSNATVTPGEAYEDTELLCEAGTPSDVDGDSITNRYTWYVSDALVGNNTDTLDGAFFDRGDRVRCVVTPYDGSVTGDSTASNTVLIRNTAPTVGTVTIDDRTPAIGDVLTVTVTGGDDLDGDDVEYLYQWRVDGVPDTTDETFDTTGLAQGTLVTVAVTPYDGTDAGTPVESAPAMVQNSGPELVTVGLSPLTPYTNEALIADWTGTDPDGDPLQSSFRWLVNDLEVAGVTGDALPASETAKNDVVRVEVTVTDTSGLSDTRTAGPSVVLNSAPQLTSVLVFPTTATESTELTCTPAGWFDLDGDDPGYDIVWYVNTAPAAFGDTIDGAFFDRDDQVVCRVTPNDGDIGGIGADVDSMVVTIRNTAPTLGGVTLDPPVPTELVEVLAVPTDPFDLDDDFISYTYDWYVNDARVSGGPVLDGSDFERGDEVYVVMTPQDGTDVGGPQTSATVIVGNSPPVITDVTIGPDEPGSADDLFAVVDVEDPDANDTVSLTYTWYVDDVVVQDGPLDTLPGSNVASGARVYVVVTPTDGTDGGDPVTSTTITVDNSPPSITGVVLQPTLVYETSTIQCIPQGWSDPDGDPEGYVFEWRVGGVRVGAGPTLGGARFDKDDVVTCFVEPYDGTSRGPGLESAPVTVSNSPPTAVAATINQVEPRETSVLRVILDDVRDADGDLLTTTHEWFVNGSSVSTADSLTGLDFDKHDVVTATVTLDDGDDTFQLTTDPVTIVNSLPRLATLTVSPSEPAVTDDVTSEWTTFDADGDTVTVSWTWYSDDGVIDGQTADTLPAGAFVKNRDLYLVGVPNDGEDDGASLTSNEIRSSNTPPTVATVTMSPTPVSKVTPPTCSGTGAADADGDSVAMVYDWYVDGEIVATAPTVPRTFVERGTSLSCAARPFDGEEGGAAVSSASYVVQNAPPSLGGVRLDNTSPNEGDSIAAIVLGATDLDGDLVSYRYAWFVNDTQVSIEPAIDSNDFDAGDLVYVSVTPFDGFDIGAPVTSAVIEVLNLPPRLDRPPRIDPNEVFTDTDVVATVSATDPDGDTVILKYDWLVNGSIVQSGDGLSTLSSSLFSRDDEITVTVTPRDAVEIGTPRTSDSSFVSNTPPTEPTVSITPIAPGPGEDLVCTLDGPSSDADGDPVSYQFRWRVGSLTFGGASTTATSSTVPGSAVSTPETWFCDALATDGDDDSGYGAAAVVQTGQTVFESCDEHLGVNGYQNGVYLIDPDGSGLMEVFCEQNIDDGGWMRIIRTTGNNHDFGQAGYGIVNGYATVTATEGVYDAFRRIREFSQIMIRQTSGAQAGEFAVLGLQGGSQGLTMLELLETCRDETEALQDDLAFTGIRVLGHTSVFSGSRALGDLRIYHQNNGTSVPVDKVLVCGINTSSDNDVSYLAFTNAPGDLNDWGDSWRRQQQYGTIWSFANNDYCCGSGNHIGTGTPQAYGGWRGEGLADPTANHQGTYEIFIR